jgi:hypothetical protein
VVDRSEGTEADGHLTFADRVRHLQRLLATLAIRILIRPLTLATQRTTLLYTID